MKRTKITFEFNLDEVTLLGAALIHAIRNGWSDPAIKCMYPQANMDYMLEQITVAMGEIENAQ